MLSSSSPVIPYPGDAVLPHQTPTDRTMQRADLHHLTRLIYQSVVDSSKWSHALTALADSFDAHHVLVGLRARGDEPEYLCARVDHSHLRRFWQVLDESPFREFPAKGPTGVFVSSAAVLESRVFLSSEFYQDLLRPMGGHHGMLGLPFRSHGEQSFFSVCRSRQQGEFAADSLSRLQTLMPHIQTALCLQRRLSRSDSQLWHRECVLDQLGIGVVLLDKRQRPLVANRRARELIGLRSEVVIGPHGLSPVNANLDEWPRAAAAVFIDTSDQSQLHPEVLRAWFGFSARETELAVLLAMGTDLASSAKAMHIGLETARTHLDRLFAKTGTCRQAELVSVLLRAAWRL